MNSKWLGAVVAIGVVIASSRSAFAQTPESDGATTDSTSTEPQREGAQENFGFGAQLGFYWA